MCPSSQDVDLTALCVCGRPAMVSDLMNNGRHGGADAVKCSSALIVGLKLDESRLHPWHPPPKPSSTVETLNSVNRASATFNIRILPPTSETEVPLSMKKRHRPFLLVYKIDEIPSSHSTAVTPGTRRDTGGSGTTGMMAPTSNILAQLVSTPLATTLPVIEDEPLSDIEEELLGLPHEDPWAMDLDPSNNNSLIDPLIAPPPPLPSSGDFMAAFGTKEKPMRSDLLQVQYDPPNANLLVLQCFRLPSTFDMPDFEIHKILPSSDGLYVLVVVNRVTNVGMKEKDKEDTVSAGLLWYRLSFTGLMTGLVEQPVKEIVLKGPGRRIQSVALLPADNNEMTVDRADLAAMVNEGGELQVIDLETGKTLFKECTDFYVDITRANGNFSVLSSQFED